MITTRLTWTVTALGVGILIAASAAKAMPTSEYRDHLNGLLDEAQASGRFVLGTTENEAEQLVRAYRGGAAGSGSDAGVPSIADAPYPRFLLAMKTQDLWLAAYNAAWGTEWDKEVNHVSLEVLYDGFMQAILNDDLPESLKDTGSQIGKCLAKKIEKGKSDSCPLDFDEDPAHIRAHAPGKIEELWLKLTCHLNVPSPCHTRQSIFNAAKEELIAARLSPEIQDQVGAVFKTQFDEQFPQGFLQEIADQTRGFPNLVSAKFHASKDALWSDPLVEQDDPGVVTLSEFASGLKADIRLAAAFAHSPDPTLRKIAAPLLYAAANRLVLLMGGNEASWDANGYRVQGTVEDGKPIPYPDFELDAFGGWAATRAGNFGSWDWENYDPTDSVHPSPMQIFASEFRVGSRAIALPVPDVAPEETLSDLSELLEASLDFLAATKPGGPLGGFFAPAKNFGDVIAPDLPMIFPREGRQLAIGVIAGVLKNLAAPGIGHLELAQSLGKEGTSMSFYDRVCLDGRVPEAASVRGVAKILVAAADARRVLAADPDTPDSLRKQFSVLSDAVSLGALTLGGQGQDPDGGFTDQLGVPAYGGRSLSIQIAGLRAMQRAYEGNRLPFYKMSARLGWAFLDRFWDDNRALPRSLESVASARAETAELWSVWGLWNEMGASALKADLADDVDWALWQRRMRALRKALEDRLQTL